MRKYRSGSPELVLHKIVLELVYVPESVLLPMGESVPESVPESRCFNRPRPGALRKRTRRRKRPECPQPCFKATKKAHKGIAHKGIPVSPEIGLHDFYNLQSPNSFKDAKLMARDPVAMFLQILTS